MLDINDIHVISIHTPLAGSDRKTLKTSANSWNFNPHSPCGERPKACLVLVPFSEFQSTLPLRGATRRFQSFARLNRYFNPHSPCGERPYFAITRDDNKLFQSTLPLRGATQIVDVHVVHDRISIHTPLAGSDSAFEMSSMWTL